MNKKIAIPIEDGMLCAHFGHCEYFYVADLVNNEIVKEEMITPPEHQPGLYPACHPSLLLLKALKEKECVLSR